MLTEVDTREASGVTVSLYMDTDAKVYLVCVEGFEPITCLTRDYALQVWHHPLAYMPVEGHRSDSNGLEGLDPTERTSRMLVELRDVLTTLDESDYQWTVALVSDVVKEVHRARFSSRPEKYPEDEVEF